MGTVVEANPQLIGDARAARLSSVPDIMRAGKACWIGYVELREGTRQDVVAFVEQLARSQAQVSLSGRFWLMVHTALCVAPRALSARVSWLGPIHRLLDRHAVTIHEEHSYLSGELVARALERGGFIWDRDPAHVTPYDLFQRFHFADEPAPVAPTSLAAERGKRRGSHPAPTMRQTTGAIMPFAPRSTAGANALAQQPDVLDSPEVGMRALLHLGIFMAAGLAVIGVIEELVRAGGS